MVEFKKTNERGNGRFWKMIDLYTCCLLSSIAMRFKTVITTKTMQNLYAEQHGTES